MAKRIESSKILRNRKNKRLGIAVQLYREGSGGRVVQMPSEKWLTDMRSVADLNYGEVCVVMNPSISTGYEEKYGVVLSFLPGTIKGDVGNGDPLRRPIDPASLPMYGDPRNGLFTIMTNLTDAVNLHAALGEVIRNAKGLKK